MNTKTCLSLVWLCMLFTFKIQAYALTDDAIVAQKGDCIVKYKEIKINKTMKSQIENWANKLNLSDDIKQQLYKQAEYKNLRKILRREIVNEYVKRTNVAVSEQDVEREVPLFMERNYGKKDFSEEDAKKLNAPRDIVISLLKTWAKDPNQAEVLYKDQYQSVLNSKKWEELKKEHAMDKNFEGLEKRWPAVTVEGTYFVARQMIKDRLLEDKLKLQLVRLGTIKSIQEYEGWIVTQFSSVSFPAEEMNFAEFEKAINNKLVDPNSFSQKPVEKEIMTFTPRSRE